MNICLGKKKNNNNTENQDEATCSQQSDKYTSTAENKTIKWETLRITTTGPDRSLAL